MNWTLSRGNPPTYDEFHALEASCFSHSMYTPVQFNDLDKDYLWSVRLGERLIGFMYVGVLEGRIHIRAIAVAEEYRRRGIAQQLFAQAFELAGQLGVLKVTLAVLSQNLPAMSLYIKLGFGAVGQSSRFSVPLATLPDAGEIAVEREGEGYAFWARLLKNGVLIGRGHMNTEIGGCKDLELDNPAANLPGALSALKGLLKPESSQLYVMTSRADVIQACRACSLPLDCEIIEMERIVA